MKVVNFTVLEKRLKVQQAGGASLKLWLCCGVCFVGENCVIAGSVIAGSSSRPDHGLHLSH